ncbi:MAG: AmmeMemoRadiSam system protein B, partial [Deltaproteobacteria bacterium RBG_19FT_COMBO_56_10]
LFRSDFEAHIMEHSLEVQLPFIRALNQAAKIVPVTVMAADAREREEMGKALAGVVSKAGERVLLLVSSDMNHYEPDHATRVK